jgi:RND family efflux transporter MFP subunit
VRVSENGLLRLTLPVPESAVPLTHLGEPVNVRVSALNRSFPGRVARFSDKLDESTRTMQTEVDVPNASLVLVPGMYAEVDLVTEKRKNALTVPVEAVDGSGSSSRVFAVDSAGAIRIVPVTLGIEDAREIEVRSGDLKDGDRVVVGSRSGLKEGSTVRVKLISLQSDSATKS